MLTAAFRAFGGEELVKHFLTGLPGGFITRFMVVMFVIFLLGFFLDFIEIAVVVVPIIAPILLADTSANVTGVWLGVMIGVNMQTSFLTPPFGFALFYLRGVAPATVRTLQMYRGVIPFILLQLAGLAIVGVFPSLVNYLPNRVNLTSETAPPPRNPRLQRCVEEMVFAQYDLRGDALRQTIESARALNIAYLPKKQKAALSESFQSATNTFDLVGNVRDAETALAAYVPDYRPLHREVRDIQRKITRIRNAVKTQKTQLLRTTGDKKPIEQEIATLGAQIEQLEQVIPAEWKGARDGYLKLARAEKDARRKYRNNVDDAYDPIAETLAIIRDTHSLDALRDQIRGIESVINLPAREAMKAIEVVESAVGAVNGASQIKSKISRVRKALKGKKRNPGKAARELTEALKIFEAEVKWRQRAARELAVQLGEYEAAISDTIGLRQQERLNPDQASEIASCRAIHRDISLDF
ncbi:MAG TPA: TRAP transporter large permease subunit, partial [Rhodospirillales bacterium]|nr:TRAP transporter large permease subunit [Rhodospirillales bacterium]